MSSSQTSFVVADLYQLPRINGKFSKENKVLLRKGVKVDPNYVEEINKDSENNGKLYIVDHSATELRVEQLIKQSAEREANAKMEKVSAKDLIDALKDNSKNSTEDEEELKNLQSRYFELSGKEAKKNWKIPTLKVEVEKLETEK